MTCRRRLLKVCLARVVWLLPMFRWWNYTTASQLMNSSLMKHWGSALPVRKSCTLPLIYDVCIAHVKPLGSYIIPNSTCALDLPNPFSLALVIDHRLNEQCFHIIRYAKCYVEFISIQHDCYILSVCHHGWLLVLGRVDNQPENHCSYTRMSKRSSSPYVYISVHMHTHNILWRSKAARKIAKPRSNYFGSSHYLNVSMLMTLYHLQLPQNWWWKLP